MLATCLPFLPAPVYRSSISLEGFKPDGDVIWYVFVWVCTFAYVSHLFVVDIAVVMLMVTCGFGTMVGL